MAWEFNFDSKLKCAFITYHEKLELYEIALMYEDLFADPEYRDGMNLLFDLSLIKFPKDYTFKTISEEANKVITDVNRRLGAIKLAVVVGNANDYKLFHQWIVSGRLTTGQVERKLFRETENAFAWIGLPEGYAIPRSGK